MVQDERFSEWLDNRAGTAVTLREHFAAASCRIYTYIVYQRFSLSPLSNEEGPYNRSALRVTKAALEGTLGKRTFRFQNHQRNRNTKASSWDSYHPPCEGLFLQHLYLIQAS